MRTRSWMTLGALALGLAATAPAAAQDYEEGYEEYAEMREEMREDALEENEHFARFRFGISGLGGGHWAGGPDIGMGGASLRLGVQLGDMFALYYQPTGMIGSITDRDPGRDSIAGLMWNTAMFDFTFFDMLQVGGGPSVDFIWGCDETIQDEVDCARSEAEFGLDGRVAVVLGGMEPGSRQGFVIEARIHPTWYDFDEDPSIAVLGGLGFEVY